MLTCTLTSMGFQRICAICMHTHELFMYVASHPIPVGKLNSESSLIKTLNSFYMFCFQNSMTKTFESKFFHLNTVDNMRIFRY